MFCKVNSCICSDTEKILVSVETDIRNGLPGFYLCGASSEIKESKERVRVSVENSGFLMQPKRITVNISPQGIKKNGSYLDLPMAVSVLGSYGFVTDELEDYVFIGELSLDGRLKNIQSPVTTTLYAREKGFSKIVMPFENAREAYAVEGISVYGIKELSEIYDVLMNNAEPISKSEILSDEDINVKEYTDFKMFRNVNGLKRDIEAAIIGKFSIILITSSKEKGLMFLNCINGLKSDVKPEIKMLFHELNKNNESSELCIAKNGIMIMDGTSKNFMEKINHIEKVLHEKIIVFSVMSLCPCGFYPDLSRCTCTPSKIKRHISRQNTDIINNAVIFPVMIEKPDDRKEEYSKSTEDMQTEIDEAVRFIKENKERNTILSDENNEFLLRFFEREVYTEKIYKNIVLAARAYADLDRSKDINREHLEEAMNICVYMKKGEVHD